MSKMKSFWNSEIMTVFWDFLLFHFQILRVSIDYKFLLSMVYWRWLLIVSRSKIWLFAKMVNFPVFPDDVCSGGLKLLKFLVFLLITQTKKLRLYGWRLAFTNRDLCLSFAGSPITLEIYFFRWVIFHLTSCRRGMISFTPFSDLFLFPILTLFVPGCGSTMG